jgi:hypothetical protein
MNNTFPYTCLKCGKALTGRSDKKFCNAYCRNSYNNQNKAADEPIHSAGQFKDSPKRRILKDHCPEGKATVRKERLLDMGFSFQYFSSIYKKGSLTYYFSHEFGFAPITHQSTTKGIPVQKVLIIQYQEHMKGKFDPCAA